VAADAKAKEKTAPATSTRPTTAIAPVTPAPPVAAASVTAVTSPELPSTSKRRKSMLAANPTLFADVRTSSNKALLCAARKPVCWLQRQSVDDTLCRVKCCACVARSRITCAPLPLPALPARSSRRHRTRCGLCGALTSREPAAPLGRRCSASTRAKTVPRWRRVRPVTPPSPESSTQKSATS